MSRASEAEERICEFIEDQVADLTQEERVEVYGDLLDDVQALVDDHDDYYAVRTADCRLPTADPLLAHAARDARTMAEEKSRTEGNKDLPW